MPPDLIITQQNEGLDKLEISDTRKILDTRSFSVQTVQEFKSACIHELKALGLLAFEFARVFDDGTAIILYSDPKIGHYIVEKKVHITAHLSETLINERIWYVPSPNGPYQQLLVDIQALSGGRSFVDYIERNPTYFDMFCFWSPLDQETASGLFISLKEDLESFSLSFRDRAKDLIEKTLEDKFKLPTAMLPNIQGLGSQNQVGQTSFDLDLHFKRIKRDLYRSVQLDIPGGKFTPRELDCIWHVILGKDSAEIAKKLKLSTRTVEHYLGSVKTKLGCRKKSEIIDQLRALSA